MSAASTRARRSWRLWPRKPRRTSSRRTRTSVGPTRRGIFFQRTGGDYAPKMMDALAELYWEQGKAGESTRVYKKIIAENMRSPRVCEWQGKVLRNTLSAARQGASRRRSWSGWAPCSRRCRRSRRTPPRPSAATPFTTPRASWRSSGTARRPKTQVEPTYAFADGAYRLFLTHFPADKQAYEMRFYAGEVAVGAQTLEGRRRALHARSSRHSRAANTCARRRSRRCWRGRTRTWSTTSATAGAGSRARTPDGGAGVRQGRRRSRSRTPAEDDRRVPRLREAGARRARAAGDDLPRGVHLLRPQPLRRAPSRSFWRSSTSIRHTSWRCSPPTCSSTR